MTAIEMTGTLEELYVAASRIMGDEWAEFLHESDRTLRSGGQDYLLFSPQYLRQEVAGSPRAESPMVQRAIRDGLWWLGFTFDITAGIDSIDFDYDEEADDD